LIYRAGLVIDLRSDTVSRPTPAMRKAMAEAEVGDDVYAEDPTVIALEERVADMFGFEAALFTVSGSLANLLAVRCFVEPGTEVLCEAQAHIARAEMGAHGVLSGITMRTWSDPAGAVDVDAIEALLAPDLGPFLVRTACISYENTHNFAGGTIQPDAAVSALHRLANEAGVAIHLDGARIWNAHIATRVPLRELASAADAMAVCLSKGLGAPIGSLMLGTRDHVIQARVRRKRLGAGWRQAGVLAAAGLYAIEHHVERLADDHEHARLIAAAVQIDPTTVPTNIVAIPTASAASVVGGARSDGVLVSAVGPRLVRAVTHLDITRDDAERAAKVLATHVAR
jgi:threonine aldolase